MKLVTTLSVAAAALALSSPVFAQAASKNVLVSASLTPVCQFTTSADMTIALGTYVAFGPAVTGTGTATVQCTRRSTDPLLSFDSSVGLVNGLTYNLSAAYGSNVAGSDPDGTASSIGVARTGVVTVTATLLAGQAGAGTGGLATAAAKILTVTF